MQHTQRPQPAQYMQHEHAPAVAQIVALDECDPTTFNANLGPDFCKNISLGFFTTFNDLFTKAAQGTPDPNWDFAPDSMRIDEGTLLSVVDQGGEPHTFTEVAHFGGGFVTGLNAPGEQTVPECEGGFGNVDVARTRILQGSTLQVPGLDKGDHHFQCCIHPWMRVNVQVKKSVRTGRVLRLQKRNVGPNLLSGQEISTSRYRKAVGQYFTTKQAHTAIIRALTTCIVFRLTLL